MLSKIYINEVILLNEKTGDYIVEQIVKEQNLNLKFEQINIFKMKRTIALDRLGFFVLVDYDIEILNNHPDLEKVKERLKIGV